MLYISTSHKEHQPRRARLSGVSPGLCGLPLLQQTQPCCFGCGNRVAPSLLCLGLFLFLLQQTQPFCFGCGNRVAPSSLFRCLFFKSSFFGSELGLSHIFHTIHIRFLVGAKLNTFRCFFYIGNLCFHTNSFHMKLVKQILLHDIDHSEQ